MDLSGIRDFCFPSSIGTAEERVSAITAILPNSGICSAEKKTGSVPFPSHPGITHIRIPEDKQNYSHRNGRNIRKNPRRTSTQRQIPAE